MNINGWFFSGQHWLYLAGAVISIIGLIYTSCSFIGNRIPKKFTQVLAFGVLGSLSGILAYLSMILIIMLFVSLINGILKLDIQVALGGIAITSGNFILRLITSLLFALSTGIFIGSIIGLLTSSEQIPKNLESKNVHERKVQRKINWKRNIYFLFLLCLLIIISIVAWLSYQSNQIDSNIGKIALVYGFLVGFKYDMPEFKWGKIVVFIILSYLILTFLYAISEHKDVLTVVVIDETRSVLTPFILSFLLGIIFNQSRISETYLKSANWNHFLCYILLGVMLAICFTFYTTVLQTTFTQFSIAIPLLVAFGSGEGNLLIRQLKPKFTNQQEKFLPTKNTQERFLRSFLVTFTYYLIYISLTFYGLGLVFGFDSPRFDTELIPKVGLPLYLFLFFLIIAATGALLGCIAGVIYSFGPLLIIYLKNMSERRMLQLGVLFSMVGIIVLILPGLLT